MKYNLTIRQDKIADFDVTSKGIININGDSLYELLAKLPLEVHRHMDKEVQKLKEKYNEDDIPF